MRRSLLLLSVLSLLLVLVGCASEPAKTETPAPEAAAPEAAAPDASADPLSGTWTGDWGPNAGDRNQGLAACRIAIPKDGLALGTVRHLPTP